MALALFCAGAVAAFAVLGGPREPVAAAKAATEGGPAPLTRSDPGVEPWKEEPVDPVEAETEEAEPEPEPAPEYEPRPVEIQPEPEPEPVG